MNKKLAILMVVHNENKLDVGFGKGKDSACLAFNGH